MRLWVWGSGRVAEIEFGQIAFHQVATAFRQANQDPSIITVETRAALDQALLEQDRLPSQPRCGDDAGGIANAGDGQDLAACWTAVERQQGIPGWLAEQLPIEKPVTCSASVVDSAR